MRKGLYDNEAEMTRHMNAIHTIQTQTGAPSELITGLYEEALERLKGRARVKDFLPILASREVKASLKAPGASGLH